MTDEELLARLREFDPYTHELEVVDEAADRIEALEAKLATCEKYRDAYAECDRIGTQAVRDLEAKLAKAVEALDRLIALNDDYSPFAGEMFQDRVDRTWQKARATIEEIRKEKTK